MKLVVLTQGFYAKVNDCDYALLVKWCWKIFKVRGTARYACRTTGPGGRTTLLMHRVILGAPANREVDHINGDGLDNRRCNLRLVTRRQNAANAQPQQGRRKKGYYWNKEKRRWQAQIGLGARTLYLGRFATQREAADAYDVAARRLRGDFALTNARIRAAVPKPDVAALLQAQGWICTCGVPSQESAICPVHGEDEHG